MNTDLLISMSDHSQHTTRSLLSAEDGAH